MILYFFKNKVNIFSANKTPFIERPYQHLKFLHIFFFCIEVKKISVCDLIF